MFEICSIYHSKIDGSAHLKYHIVSKVNPATHYLIDNSILAGIQASIFLSYHANSLEQYPIVDHIVC